MSLRRIGFRLSAGFIWICLFALGSGVLAQSSAPIQIGQNAFGELTAEVSTASFALTPTSGATATVQVLALSAGFVPRFRIVNPSGVEILNVANPNGLATITGSASFDAAGTFTIEVTGENGSIGQFVLSLQPGAVLPEPVDLALDQSLSGSVGSQTPVRVYSFSTTVSDSLILTILAQTPGEGPLVSLYDQEAGRTIASNDAGVSGVAYRLPAENKLYRVEVHVSGAAGDTAFTICLGACGGSGLLSNAPTAVSTAIPVAETPEAAAASCTVASSAGGSVNLRSGNGTQYIIVGSLPPGQSYPVLGQNAGNGVWYQVDLNGTIGWVSASVTRLEGDCTALPSIAAPVNARLAPTSPPVIQPTAAPPSGNSNNGGTNPTATPKPTDVPAPLLPDLTPVNLRVVRNDNGDLVAYFMVRNGGTAPYTPDRTFSIVTCFDGFDNCTEVRSSIPITLPPGDGSYDSSPLPGYSTGESHSVNVTLDARGEIGELNESNNTASITFNF